LRAIHGDGSGEVSAVTDARCAVRRTALVAVGDIDLDVRPEILALAESSDALLALEHDSAFKWRNDLLPCPYVIE
jgi:hypothetical protein